MVIEELSYCRTFSTIERITIYTFSSLQKNCHFTYFSLISIINFCNFPMEELNFLQKVDPEEKKSLFLAIFLLNK
jgi:hypothetical protein